MDASLETSRDQQLMFAVRDGDLDKLGPLFEKHHKQLYNHFVLQTGSTHVSEDLVQEVFFRMLKYRHTYRGEAKFSTWMLAIAHNALLEHHRKNRNKTEPIDDLTEAAGQDATPDKLLDRHDRESVMKRALSKLSDEKREVLLLSRFQEMKYEEIARITGLKIGTIKSRVFFALKDLAKIYGTLTGEGRS